MSAPILKVSDAQAKRLASMFVGNQAGHIAVHDGHMSQTDKRIVANMWSTPTGYIGQFPSGNNYREHAISREGMRALCRYLTAFLAKTDSAPAPVEPQSKPSEAAS